MTSKQFKSYFNQILYENPLPFGYQWQLQHLQNSSLNDPGWSELLYRTFAEYKCKRGHRWKSAWAMVIFRFRLDFRNGFGRVRMRRFGVRCRECGDKDDSYHVGICSETQTWYLVQCLLRQIVPRCYGERFYYDDDDVQNVVIIETDVPSGGNGGGSHPKDLCEACANNCCQERFKRLTKKK
ncbi:unnamed protein product [Adineta steineri]|uniref:3CxxC-type domain-containing protein n=1 Tax=Adineta steineri TaxID=433720 RepID=A0A815IDM5_9BILA|nr:unnamed protein product [Adineta steineri]CAF1366940.1 unnamed protein product [Adineta steineri]CAF1380497.1 unnamed protein product [Adineta steineri]